MPAFLSDRVFLPDADNGRFLRVDKELFWENAWSYYFFIPFSRLSKGTAFCALSGLQSLKFTANFC